MSQNEEFGFRSRWREKKLVRTQLRGDWSTNFTSFSIPTEEETSGIQATPLARSLQKLWPSAMTIMCSTLARRTSVTTHILLAP